MSGFWHGVSRDSETTTHGCEEAAAEQGAGAAVACVASSERGGSSQSREDSGKDECDYAGCDHRSEQSEISPGVG